MAELLKQAKDRLQFSATAAAAGGAGPAEPEEGELGYEGRAGEVRGTIGRDLRATARAATSQARLLRVRRAP